MDLEDIGPCKPCVHSYSFYKYSGAGTFVCLESYVPVSPWGDAMQQMSPGNGAGRFYHAGAEAAGSCLGVKAELQVTHVLPSHMETLSRNCIRNTGRPPSNEIVKYARLWTVRLCWSA